MATWQKKNLYHGNSITATTSIITCPAGHAYLIKGAIVTGANASGQFHFEMSDNAGANFRRVTEIMQDAASGSTGSSHGVGNRLANPANFGLADPAASGQNTTLFNLVMVEGHVLKYVEDAAATVDIDIDGIDITL